MIKLTIILSLIARELVVGEDYRCRSEVPQNCMNNPVIRVSKTTNDYKLKLCSNNNCIPTNFKNLINCRDVCEVCGSLPGQNGKNKMVHKKKYLTHVLFQTAVMMASVKYKWMPS